MAKNTFDLIVIGGGAGGLSTASGAARIGLKTLLIENDKMGGDCLWNGCVPSKTLLHEAEKMKVFKENNIEVDREKFFNDAKNAIVKVQNKIYEHDSKEVFQKKGVEIKIGTAKFISRNEIEVSNSADEREVFKFKKCVIATGSRPFVPPMFQNIKVETSDTIFNLDKLPKKFIVIGGGPVGIEIATAMSAFGVDVSIVQREPKIMMKEEDSVGEFMKSKIEELGIKVYLNAEIKSVESKSDASGNKSIVLDLGQDLKIDCDNVFVAAGRSANVMLDLEKANIAYSNKGIEINKYLATSNKNVYAIGDVNGKMQFTHAAGYQAKAALQNMFIPRWISFFKPSLKKTFTPKAFPWVTYTYPEVAHVGQYKKDLDLEKVKYESFVTNLESVDRAKTNKTNKDGFIEVLVGKKGKILGVTIVSPFAGELITEWVLAMENNLSVEKIYETVHAYPTLSELNVMGTFEYMSRKLNKTRSFLLRLLFKL